MTPAPADRPLLGILLMTGFCVAAPLADGVAKLLSETLPLLVLLLARFVLQIALCLPLALWIGAPLLWSGRITALVALRGVLHVAGIGAMFLALRYLPLAEAIAIAYVMPFVLLLLGWMLLGEAVGLRRVLACVAGFAGTLLVIRPSLAEVGAPALLPLAVAVIFALFMLVTRRIAQEVHPVAMQVTGGAVSLLVLVPLVAVAVPEVTWSAGALRGLLVLGLLGTGSHLLMSWSLRHAPASTLAPMQYLEIPFAALFGWLLFREFPDGMALAGIAVTVAAGLYVILRERTLSAAAPRAPAPPIPQAAPPAA